MARDKWIVSQRVRQFVKFTYLFKGGQLIKSK